MFGDGKGLNAEVKFAIASTYDRFVNRWGALGSRKLGWTDTWSELLSEWNVPTINSAAQFCTDNLARPPTLFEFQIYCRRVADGEDLHAPIVSSEEEIARQVLEFCSTLGVRHSMVTDGCLIAGNIAAAISHMESQLPWDEKSVEASVIGRARMFGMESLHWVSDARKGKGYWHDFLSFDGNNSDRSTDELTVWIFGYGSLMWDSWETEHGCIRRVVADLPGFCRRFNKQSVRNWGTEAAPGPTLNLTRLDSSVCRGIAFQFPDAKKTEVLSYLEKREGKGFPLHEMAVRLDDQSEVSAFVPLYNGKNIIDGKTLEEVAEMVLAASGTKGTCLSYVNGIAANLSALDIDDPAVTDLWKAVNDHS